ncbi:DUF2249 domain-containing protein [Haloarcula laminariae]|uniref:DUF2249 domain-containing protein n=1 Tax=Haloarcula laminariae TaxID=2961577 RepID=UPI0024050019|nr:DUF2249 domain-containing protein [Halomicroarcula sp. FL173]
MTDTLDLRDRSETARTPLFDVLDETEPGRGFAVVADDDIDTHLVRYQLERDRAVDWEYADPDAEPREIQVTVEGSLDGSLATIDVRDLKPQRRHEALLGIFDDLDVSEGFVLVNDHDPKPLYHELRSMHGDVVEWEYASRGSGEWRVEVVKTGDSAATDDDIVTRYDVRDIPKPERHPTIHHRYGMLPEGGTLELVAPHEPKPLHQEFRQRYGDSFTWEVVESEPGRCRVHITNNENVEEAAEQTDSDDVAASPSDEERIEIVAEHDVRELPPAQRHERIFEAYSELDTGTGFVLVNDHDPKPLYHQFDAEAGPEFRWAYRQREPDEFRVLIGKAEDPTDSDGGEQPEAPF